MVNFTTADRIGSIGGYIGGISTLLGGAGLLGNNMQACGDNMPVNRYEASLLARQNELETEVKLRDANTFTMGEMGKLRDYVDGKFAHVEHELCEQRVYNATNTATISCLAQQVNGLQGVLNGITKCVVPNSAICPGWGDVTVTPATTTTTGA